MNEKKYRVMLLCLAILPLIMDSKAAENLGVFLLFSSQFVLPGGEPSWEEISSPGAGSHAVPLLARAATSMMEKLAIPDYRVSAELRANALIYQRIVEFSLPRRPQRDSRWLLRLAKEQPEVGCMVRETSNDAVAEIELAYCP